MPLQVHDAAGAGVGTGTGTGRGGGEGTMNYHWEIDIIIPDVWIVVVIRGTGKVKR